MDLRANFGTAGRQIAFISHYKLHPQLWSNCIQSGSNAPWKWSLFQRRFYGSETVQILTDFRTTYSFENQLELCLDGGQLHFSHRMLQNLLGSTGGTWLTSTGNGAQFWNRCGPSVSPIGECHPHLSNLDMTLEMLTNPPPTLGTLTHSGGIASSRGLVWR